MQSKKLCLASVAAILGFTGTAFAQIPWGGGMASGSASWFNWENGRNGLGLFGTPVLVGDTFIFTPSNFVAVANDGQTTTVSDYFEVDLLVHNGFKFDSIQVAEYGDYAMTSTNPSPLTPSIVSSSAVLAVDEIGGLGRSATSPLSFPGLPASSTTNVANTIWSGGGAQNLTLLETGGPFTAIHIRVTNELIAISGGNGMTAEIRKTVFGGEVAVTIVPTPGAAGILGLAGIFAARRRRA